MLSHGQVLREIVAKCPVGDNETLDYLYHHQHAPTGILLPDAIAGIERLLTRASQLALTLLTAQKCRRPASRAPSPTSRLRSANCCRASDAVAISIVKSS